MKNILGTCLSGLALALLLIVGGAAQENFVIGGGTGVRGLHGRPVLPPAVIFSNCGPGCTSYSNTTGYYVSGTALAAAPGQTLAMGFAPRISSTFSFALTPNAVFTDNGGASSGKLSAFLLHGSATKGPTAFLAKLTQHRTIPDFPAIKLIRWTSTKMVSLKKGVTYFLCETEPAAHVQVLWMASNSDTTSPFWFQENGSCTAKGLNWVNATGSAEGPALDVVHTN